MKPFCSQKEQWSFKICISVVFDKRTGFFFPWKTFRVSEIFKLYSSSKKKKKKMRFNCRYVPTYLCKVRFSNGISVAYRFVTLLFHFFFYVFNFAFFSPPLFRVLFPVFTTCAINTQSKYETGSSWFILN